MESREKLRDLITDNTAQWAQSIFNQKSAVSAATNAAADQMSPSFATTRTSEPPMLSPILAEEGANASNSQSGEYKLFTVCENGEAKDYEFIAREPQG